MSVLEGGYALEGRNSAFRKSVAAHLRALVRDDDDYDDDDGYPLFLKFIFFFFLVLFPPPCDTCERRHVYFWQVSLHQQRQLFNLKCESIP